jgi:hypothetical protein
LREFSQVKRTTGWSMKEHVIEIDKFLVDFSYMLNYNLGRPKDYHYYVKKKQEIDINVIFFSILP